MTETLTREQIEEWRKWYWSDLLRCRSPYKDDPRVSFNALCDMALGYAEALSARERAERELNAAKLALADEGYELDLIPLAAKCALAECRAYAAESRLAEAKRKCAEWEGDVIEKDALIGSLTQKLAEATRDAARYQWVRTCNGDFRDVLPHELDAALDAAIAAMLSAAPREEQSADSASTLADTKGATNG